MKLNKKEAGMIRQVAFYKNVSEQNVTNKLSIALSSLPEKKRSLGLAYYQYLTTNDGIKTYVVDFMTNGAGYLTFHNYTPEEAKEKAISKLQNGAFGKHEQLEDIVIEKIQPETIYYNQFEDFIQWESQLSKSA